MTEALHDELPPHRRPAAILLVATLGAFFVLAIWLIPRDHHPLSAVARYALTTALTKWRTTEPVNEVVYGSRGFDTFGETFLLMAAVIGIGMVTRPREQRRGFIGEEAAARREQSEIDPGGGSDGHHKKGTDNASGSETEARDAESEEQGKGEEAEIPDFFPLGVPGPERAQAMSPVVRGAVRFASPVLLTAGIFLAAWGYSPGGGFPAGAVVVGVVLLGYVALGYRRIERVVRPGIAEPLEIVGALLIVLCEVLGLVLKGSFSANFLPLAASPQTPLSGGTLQWFSGSELIEVATGLTLAIFGLLGMEHDWTLDETTEEDAGGQRFHEPVGRLGAGGGAP